MEAAELDWIDCFGDNNGEAFSVATGGTSPYSFSWDNFQTGDTVSSLTPGFHTVVVTDARGCTAEDTIFTHEPDTLLYINIDSTQTIFPYCVGVNTASLTGIAGGGTPGYTYEWDDNPVQPQTTATATALLADNFYSLDSSYTITVTDSKGCVASITSDILRDFADSMTDTNISLLTYGYWLDQSDTIVSHVSCYGAFDGQASLSGFGGHAPYSYQWIGPNGYTSTNDTIFNLSSGVYSVTIRDTNNCMVNTSIVITQPNAILFTTFSSTNESCLGACDAEVEVFLEGGVPPYSYIATENTTANIITNVMSSDSIVSGICSGSYTFTFSDENGCSSTIINSGEDQQTVSTNIITVAEINTSTITNVLCNGMATGELEVLDPDSLVAYSWQDLNGNVVPGTITASNLLAGTYVLYADYNDSLGFAIAGCTDTTTVTVTELPIIHASAVVTDVDCFGNSTGILEVSINGGIFPYTYLWNDGSASEDLSGLSSGTYTLIVIDSNDCQESFTFDVSEPQELLANITQSGYVLTADIPAGGSAPYSYLWMEQNLGINPPATGLNYVVDTYGNYYVVITDANGCESVSNVIAFEEPTSTVDLTNSINLNIYPNPFKQETTVDFGIRINEVTIRLVDVYGKLIERYELKDIDKHIITRGNKASGVYFMEIELEGITMFNKMIIE